MVAMAHRMAALGYDVDLEHLRAWYLVGGQHIRAPTYKPYTIEWRLVGQVGPPNEPSDVPTSFLSVEYAGPLTKEMITATGFEFGRITAGTGIGRSEVDRALADAEKKLANRIAAAPDSPGGWHADSNTPARFGTSDPNGAYLVCVHIHAKAPDQLYRSRVLVYFPYFSPGPEIELDRVSTVLSVHVIHTHPAQPVCPVTDDPVGQI